MMPQISKINLTSHISFSLGWLGAVLVFLVLAIVGLTSSNLITAQSAYVAMEISAAYVIVPLCFASLVTGIIQAVSTKWGLLKYYWITLKLFLTVFISVFLLLHMQPIAYLSGLASEGNIGTKSEYGLRVQMIADAGAAIISLLFITTISVYKPWGLVRSTSMNLVGTKSDKSSLHKPLGFYILIALLCLVVIIVLMHLFGIGMSQH